MNGMKENLAKIIIGIVAFIAIFTIGVGLKKKLKAIDEEEKAKITT